MSIGVRLDLDAMMPMLGFGQGANVRCLLQDFTNLQSKLRCLGAESGDLVMLWSSPWQTSRPVTGAIDVALCP